MIRNVVSYRDVQQRSNKKNKNLFKNQTTQKQRWNTEATTKTTELDPQ